VLWEDDFESGMNGWTTIDLTLGGTFWHTSSEGAFEGDSWWCSDEAVGGYLDHWLQYLDSPVWDLSATSNPTLTFQANWIIETPGGEPAPYDGWDTANVWASTDGGNTWEVIEPSDGPVYNISNSYAFGFEFWHGSRYSRLGRYQ
jgi:hypothetical protein